jgi:cytochrome oxidase assembly protein ShyY1
MREMTCIAIYTAPHFTVQYYTAAVSSIIIVLNHLSIRQLTRTAIIRAALQHLQQRQSAAAQRVQGLLLGPRTAVSSLYGRVQLSLSAFLHSVASAQRNSNSSRAQYSV